MASCVEMAPVSTSVTEPATLQSFPFMLICPCFVFDGIDLPTMPISFVFRKAAQAFTLFPAFLLAAALVPVQSTHPSCDAGASFRTRARASVREFVR